MTSMKDRLSAVRGHIKETRALDDGFTYKNMRLTTATKDIFNATYLEYKRLTGGAMEEFNELVIRSGIQYLLDNFMKQLEAVIRSRLEKENDNDGERTLQT